MKLDFWFDLPSAILPLLSDSTEKNQQRKTAQILSSSIRILTKSMKEFQFSLSQVPKELIQDKDKFKSELKTRLHKIQADKTEMLCKTVKLSTVLFRSALKEIDSESLSAKKLQRVKLILKLVKLFSERANAAKIESKGKQFEFFNMCFIK